MSALPGRRHRTLAPTSVLREADVAALERANAALAHGAHGYREQGLELTGGSLVGWSILEHRLEASGTAAALYDLARWQGSILIGVALRAWQHNAGAPLELAVELVRPASAAAERVELVGRDASELEPRTWASKSLALTAPGRPRGWRIPAGTASRARVRVTGNASDELVELAIFVEDPPP